MKYPISEEKLLEDFKNLEVDLFNYDKRFIEVLTDLLNDAYEKGYADGRKSG